MSFRLPRFFYVDNVPVTPGTGTSIATDDIGGVQYQRMKLVWGIDGIANDASATNPLPTSLNSVGIEPFGALQVNAGFQTLFYDSWSTALDTTDKWTVVGNAPVIANGNMTMSATAASYNAIKTKDTVRANVGFSLVRNGISIETAASTGAGRFWGLGTPASTPMPNVLAQDGAGFEIDQLTGALLAVTYAAGTRTTIATLTMPTDGLNHAYGTYFRVTQAYWILDGVTVASKSFPNIQMVELPALIVRQNGAAFTGTPAFVNIAHLTADTSRQGVLISDPIIGTRQARVKAPSTAAVAADMPMVVALHPSSSTPNFVAAQAVTGSFFQATQPVTGTFFQTTQPVSLATNTPDVTDRAARLLGNITELRAATLLVTNTGIASAAVTLTLPAAAAGLFHYITSLECRLYSAAARTGVAAPIIVTTTNLPGALAFSFDTAGAIGTSISQDIFSAMPIKSSSAATATTIVAPVVTGGIWRITATYFTSA